MLDLNTGEFMRGGKTGLGQIIKDFWKTGEKGKAGAEFGKPRVGDVVHPEVIKQALHISKFAVPFLLGNEAIAFFPKLRGIDTELRKQDIVLHVFGTERLIVIIDQRDGILRNCHG